MMTFSARVLLFSLMVRGLLLFLLVGSGQADRIIFAPVKDDSVSWFLDNAPLQTFSVSSLYALDEVDIAFTPYSLYDSSFHVEIWDSTLSQLLGSSSPLSVGPTLAFAWYPFVFNRHPDSESQNLLILRPGYTYQFKLQSNTSPITGYVKLTPDVYPDGHSLVYKQSYDIAFQLYATSLQVAHWPFNGTFNDISPSKLGVAIPVGSNVTLLDDYVTIRSPGYLNVPRVDIHNKSFMVAFDLRIPTSSAMEKRYLYADWSPEEWQFLSEIDAANTISVHLRRNIATNGRNLGQELVHVTSSTSIPLGEWFNVAWAFDRPGRLLTLYFNQQIVGSATVRPSVTDVTLKDSNSTDYQFGRKNDEGTDLDADLKHLYICATPDVTLPQV